MTEGQTLALVTGVCLFTAMVAFVIGLGTGRKIAIDDAAIAYCVKVPTREHFQVCTESFKRMVGKDGN